MTLCFCGTITQLFPVQLDMRLDGPIAVNPTLVLDVDPLLCVNWFYCLQIAGVLV